MSASKPFRMQMDFVCAAVGLDRATTLHDRILDLAEGMGCHFEGGFIGEMKAEDVIDGSLLGDDLKDVSS